MTIMSRVIRLFKADLHGVMDQLEDKELLIKQYLREMESNLHEKELHLQQLKDKISLKKGHQNDHLQEIEKIEKDLNLALSKEKDDIAKMLISKQRTHRLAHEHLRQHLEENEKQKSTLTSLLNEQTLSYETLKAKAEIYCHRNKPEIFSKATSVDNDCLGDCTIDENEIELEFIRRKEDIQKKGDTT